MNMHGIYINLFLSAITSVVPSITGLSKRDCSLITYSFRNDCRLFFVSGIISMYRHIRER